MTKKRHINRGFTLIELLVVIAIIAILAVLIIIRIGSAQADARDSKRKADLAQLKQAFDRYKIKYGSYKIANTGWFNGVDCTSTGPMNAKNGSYCATSIIEGLYNEGLLNSNFINDPQADVPLSTNSYRLQLCNSDQRFAIYADLEGPGSDLTNSSYDGYCGIVWIRTNRANMNYLIAD